MQISLEGQVEQEQEWPLFSPEVEAFVSQRLDAGDANPGRHAGEVFQQLRREFKLG